MAATSVKVKPERERAGYGELTGRSKVRSILQSSVFLQKKVYA